MTAGCTRCAASFTAAGRHPSPATGRSRQDPGPDHAVAGARGMTAKLARSTAAVRFSRPGVSRRMVYGPPRDAQSTSSPSRRRCWAPGRWGRGSLPTSPTPASAPTCSTSCPRSLSARPSPRATRRTRALGPLPKAKPPPQTRRTPGGSPPATSRMTSRGRRGQRHRDRGGRRAPRHQAAAVHPRGRGRAKPTTILATEHLGHPDRRTSPRRCPSSARALSWAALLQPAALDAPARGHPRDVHAIRRRRGSRATSPTALGKGVVECRDTPNFIGNRIGIAEMLLTFRPRPRAATRSKRSTSSTARSWAAQDRQLSARRHGRARRRRPRHPKPREA